MAAGSKGTGTKRSTSAGTARKRTGSGAGSTAGTKRKSSSAARSGNSKNAASYELQNEVVLMITLVVSVLLFLSNFNLGGAFGSAINGVMFGLFGILAYLFPIILFFGMAFFLANRGSRKLFAKMLYIFGMVFMLTAFIQLLTTYLPEQWTPKEEGAAISLGEYFTLAKTYKKGGGIFGGFVCYLFEPLFGRVGSFVVVIAVFLVCFMLFSKKALFAWIAKRGSERYVLHKAHAMERRESFEQRQAERERLIEEKRRELGERRAKTYLLSEEEKMGMETAGGRTEPQTRAAKKEKEKEKRNFFGGRTPTGDYTADMGGTYTLPEQTVSEVNTFYDEEKVWQNTQNTGLHMMEISPETGEYKDTTYVERQTVQKKSEYKEPVSVSPAAEPLKHTTAAHREPTVAEQLEALGGPRDRQTSGGQVFWGSSPSTETKQAERETVRDTEQPEDRHERNNADDSSTTVETKREHSIKDTERKAPAEKEAEEKPLVIEDSEPVHKHIFPPTELLTKPKEVKGVSERDLRETAQKLQSTLDSFGVRVTVTNVSCGPSVTRYELQPEQGVKVSKITSLADDIKLNLAAADVRIEAPIPGKAAVGIEVPNKENSTVLLRELLESKEFVSHGSKVAFAVGKDIGGQTVVTDIAKMPHLLIAGATGSGKSVCINTLIMSILYKADPADVKLIMVDPKVVELSVYNGIPHLMIPVVTDPKKASAALNWAVVEMTERYQKFSELKVRDLNSYNERVEDAAKQGLEEEKYKRLPQIVIIVDELADLMMVAPGEVEDSICRLAQLARAAGIHLVIATQRPSVNVITGLIKANIPSRIAFAVSSAIDSRTILDGAGAEKLLGKGDMLFFPSGYSKPVRVQGAFVSEHEVSAVVEFLKEQNASIGYNEEVTEKIANMPNAAGQAGGTGNQSGYDEYFADAGKLIIESDKASIGMLQRAYKIGFNRAARIMDQLAEAGVVGPESGTKPRKILMSLEEFEQFIGDYV
ncbi:MAG: DNA translocase FtsK [Lachnospiraceae bacterium]|nr:DNA translocase FtsK [Lachnospiraceae bacterium]